MLGPLRRCLKCGGGFGETAPTFQTPCQQFPCDFQLEMCWVGSRKASDTNSLSDVNQMVMRTGGRGPISANLGASWASLSDISDVSDTG